MQKGDKFNAEVEVIKVKNGRITKIKVNGQLYNMDQNNITTGGMKCTSTN